MNPAYLRQRALEEWRGLPQREPGPDRTRSVGEALGQVMKDLGLKDRLSEAQVMRAWKEIVGDFLAAHSAPSRIHEGVLIVSVLQPTVQFELERAWKAEILKKLKIRFGPRMIRDIRFRIGG